MERFYDVFFDDGVRKVLKIWRWGILVDGDVRVVLSYLRDFSGWNWLLSLASVKILSDIFVLKVYLHKSYGPNLLATSIHKHLDKN